MNTPFPDRYEQDLLREAVEARRAAEQLEAEFEDRVRAAFDRYCTDLTFHAEVYQLARVIDNDRDFVALFDDEDSEPGSAWEMALGLALKARVAQDEMAPGGLLQIGAAL